MCSTDGREESVFSLKYVFFIFATVQPANVFFVINVLLKGQI